MSELILLLKKEFKDNFIFSRKNKKFDFISFVFGAVIIIILAVLMFLLVSEFIKSYVLLSNNSYIEKRLRVSELLTILIFISIVFNTFQGMNEIYKNIVNSKDLEIISSLPIRHINIFLSKMLSIYVKLLFSTIIFLVPVYIACGLSLSILFTSKYSYLAIFLAIIAVSLISVFLSSIFGIIYSLVRKFLSNKFLIKLIIIVSVIAVGFYFYSKLLVFFKNFIETGDFKFAFNVGLINQINGLSKYLFFAREISQIITRFDIMKNFFILLISLIVIGVLAILIVFFLFKQTITGKSKKARLVYSNKSKFKNNNVFQSLIKKEFISVYRSSNYSFQYFVMALIVPLMTFTMVDISGELVYRVLALDAQFEISVFALILFSCLTNTFCSTNISREGNMIKELKTMPITPKQLVYSKVVFCFIITLISIFLSVILLCVFGYLNVIQGVFAVISSSLIGLSQILFSTKLDLKNPQSTIILNTEIKESNRTTSIIIILSLLISILFGAILIFLKVFDSFVLKSFLGDYLPTTIILLFSAILLGLSFLFIRHKLTYYVGAL